MAIATADRRPIRARRRYRQEELMNIPHEATDAANDAIQDAIQSGLGHEPGALAEVALEAAAPFIAAQALRDKAYDMTDPRDSDELLESADEIDGHL